MPEAQHLVFLLPSTMQSVMVSSMSSTPQMKSGSLNPNRRLVGTASQAGDAGSGRVLSAQFPFQSWAGGRLGHARTGGHQPSASMWGWQGCGDLCGGG